jgi:serine/threonine protein kinase/tetratricopeptide (TPR) repeat protein
MTTIEDLLQRWEDHQDSGCPVTPEELCADSPELLKELKWTIRALEAVDSRFGVILSESDFSAGGQSERHGLAVHERVLIPSEYSIERLHASGGLGSVYLARDPVLNRRVAIKFPRWQRLTSEQAARFEREARVTGRLDHPGIIPVHAMRTDSSDRPCYVMRFVEGETLQNRIQRLHAEGPAVKPAVFFETPEFRQLIQNVIAVCNIVAYAHQKGVIHRDIKPANIIPGPFGEVLLLDWGLAKVAGETADDPLSFSRDVGHVDTLETREGQVLGTPAFASPEQLLGRTDEVTSLSDIYSLGATLFVLLTGAISSGSSAFHEHLNRLKQGQHFSVHEQNPCIPAALEAICRHAMEIDPHKRYGSALQLADDLNCYLSGEAVSVLRDPALVRLGRWIRRRPGLAAASATGILFSSLAGMAGSAVLGQKNQELRSSNDKLVEAIEDSRAANVHTLGALRTLFDDVVTQKLGSQTELTEVDREFLKRIRQQYEIFASLKGNSVESRAIRAEGLQRSGMIMSQLGEEQESRQQLNAAAVMYEQLLKETGEAEYRRQLAVTLFDIGLSMQNSGELNAAEQTAERGIVVLDPILKQSNGTTDPDAWETYANLNRIKGSVQITMGRWNEALKSYTASKDVFEEIRKSDGESQQTLGRLAEAYRAMSDVTQNLGNIGGQEEYTASALEAYRTLLELYPDDRVYARGFCWAIYDRASAHELFGRYQHALAELSEAVAMAAKLAEKYPLSDEFRGLHASMQVRRAGIHSRVGHFLLADQDLRQSVQRLEKMVENEFDSAQSFRMLLKAERLLAILNHSHGHLQEAEEIFGKLKVHGEAFTAAFPEAAAQSWELGSLPYDVAMTQVDSGRLDEAARSLESWSESNLLKAGASDGNVLSRSSLEAQWGLVKVQIWRSQQAKAKELTDAAAMYLEKFKSQLTEDSSTWDIVPDYHLQLSNFYHLFGDHPQCRHQESEQLLVLERVARNALYPPAGQVRMVNSLIERADIFTERGNNETAVQQLEMAAATLRQAMQSTPGEPSLKKAQADLNRAKARQALDQEQYSDALALCEDVITAGPTAADRSLRILCLAHLKDPRAMTELTAELDRAVESASLPELIRACGVMVIENTDAAQTETTTTAARRFLDKANSEGVFLKPPVLARLRASKEFRELSLHHDFSKVIEKLDTQGVLRSE